jgi:hypothetical protein
MDEALCQVGDSSKDSRLCSLCTFPMRGKGLPLGHIAVCLDRDCRNRSGVQSGVSLLLASEVSESRHQ